MDIRKTIDLVEATTQPAKLETTPLPYTHKDLIFDELLTFEGQTFLEWSRGRGYPVTPTPFDHPLAAAHEAAADLCYDQYYQTVNSL